MLCHFLGKRLYVLLSLADFSLLIGSVLLFVGLSLVMFFTRRVQWYALDKDDS